DFAIDLFFAHPSRDELGHLRAEIDDENLVVAGEPIDIGAAHEGGIEDGHPHPMCGAPGVRSRPVFPAGKTSRDPYSCGVKPPAMQFAKTVAARPFRSPQPFSCLLPSL